MIALALLLAQVAGPPAPKAPAMQVKQEQLDAITEACEVPRDWLKLAGARDRVRLQPGPKAPYDTIDCLMDALHKRGIPMELGYNGSDQKLESKSGGVTIDARQQ